MGREGKAGKRERKKHYLDYSLLLIVFFLLCFGLVVLYSTSAYNGQVKFGDPATAWLRLPHHR